MNILESLSMAGKTLATNRLRSGLTMLGIIIGNASVIIMVGVGEGAKKYASQQFQTLGTDVIFIIPGSDNARRNAISPPNRLVLADADAIASQVPTVREVAPQISSSELIVSVQSTERATLIGTVPEYQTVRNAPTCLGRFFAKDDLKRNARVVTIGAEMVKKLFKSYYPEPKDSKEKVDACKPVGGSPIGQQVRIRGASYEIIGIMDAKGASLGTNQDDTLFMPFTTIVGNIVGRTSPYGIAVTVINVSAKSNDAVDAAEFQITNLLKQRHKSLDAKAEETFTIRSQKDALEIVGNITGALTIMLAAIASISLLVGGIGIMNIMLVSVTERTQEIGLRKAIGASQSDILVQFIIEAVILSVAGGLFGTAIGVGGILLVAAFTPLQAGVSGGAIMLAVGVSGAIGLFFGVVPAQQAAKLDPIVALRSI
ncbi:ABC transporter permease [Tumidithrix elongata RA019]|uniref:ABC transporter permease n=1 Tax=Tumidithrix elongata BACA0141 TaxID=2716417 RepID=A0AAW9Q2D5_9CYAN|nr:ABC transporter permease [Tumidithrix elongata RA019]